MQDTSKKPRLLPIDQIRQKESILTSITSDFYEHPINCSISDMDWNHMDQEHRPWIHKTYNDALRLIKGTNFAVSLTKVRLLGFPFMVLVTDVQLEPGAFYQGYSIWGLIYVHTIIKSSGNKVRSEWHIVSLSLFRPLHGFLHRRLKRLNHVQNLEDESMRDRRNELRKKGFGFKRTETPDFISANNMADGIILPKLDKSVRIPLQQLKMKELQKLPVNSSIDLVVQKVAENSYYIWPDACPHEGGPLSAGQHCEEELQCPWHGLKFKCLKISAEKPAGRLGDLDLSLQGEELTVSQRATAAFAQNNALS